ncbi:MAG: ABC transporter ATP-binding protein [Anaerovoracaceae bacterium]
MNSTKKITIDTLKKQPQYIAALIFLIAAVVVLSLLPPQVLKIIIDDYLLGSSKGLIFIGAIYLATFVFVGVFDFLKGYLLTVVGQKIVKEVRLEMAQKLTKIKGTYFVDNSSGTISSKFINDVDNINTLFTDGLISMVIDCFKIVGIVISIWIFSGKLAVFTICLIPVIGLLTAFFRKRMLKSQMNNLKEIGKVNNHISETINNMVMIKTFHKEKYMENRYKDYLEDNYNTMNKVNFYDSCYSPIIQMLTALAISFVFYFSMGDNNVLGISIGMIAAATNLITNLFSPIDSLGTELQSIQKGLSGIKSVDIFLKEEEEEEKTICLDMKEVKRAGIKLAFVNMSFEYTKGNKVLKNFDIEILPYENAAFVGRTGVGKTTLFKLILGILKPTEGRILVNGVDVYRISNGQKRQIIGYVEQKCSFINGTMWEQISLGDKSITCEAIEAAIDFVGLKEYVLSFENGFDTKVDESMFSEGQKQLLAIARAIVTDPPLLLLDEVTANLDSKTEQKVVEVLKKAGSGKTILSIAHRQSTIKSSEKVIEIKDGEICNVRTQNQR